MAQWQRSYDISTDAGEIVFDADYCITRDSRTTPWIAQAAVCPPCSKGDVRANGAFISETNPYVLESHLSDGPDFPALLSTCNHPSGISDTSESLLPAAGATELASSSEGGRSSSLSEGQFNLHSDIDVTGLQVAAAAPAPASVSNDGSYISLTRSTTITTTPSDRQDPLMHHHILTNSTPHSLTEPHPPLIRKHHSDHSRSSQLGYPRPEEDEETSGMSSPPSTILGK